VDALAVEVAHAGSCSSAHTACIAAASPSQTTPSLAAPPSTLGAARRRRLESGSSPTTSRHRVPRPARGPCRPSPCRRAEGRQVGISDAQRQHAEVRARPRPHDSLAIAQRRAIGRSQHARDRARSRREEQRAKARVAPQLVAGRLRRTAWRQRRCMGTGGVGRRRHSGRNCGGEVRGPSGAPGAATGGHLGRQ